MAAAYYAATLQPDPTLDDHPDDRQIADYLATGSELLTTLTHPAHISTVRCHRPRNDRFRTKALVTIHDHHLVLFERRGTAKWGGRLNRYSVVDLDLAKAEGHRSILTWCPACGDGHELNLRWLYRTPRNADSDRTFPVPGIWAPDTPEQIGPDDHGFYQYEGDLPLRANWYRNVAFARVVGTLDYPLLIMSEWFRPIRYIETFGDNPRHRDHAVRLYGDNHIVSQWEIIQQLDTFATHTDLVAQILRGEANRP